MQAYIRVYRFSEGVYVERGAEAGYLNAAWDTLFDSGDLYRRLREASLAPAGTSVDTGSCLAPIVGQEVWACGVTYQSSRLARMEESRDAGGGDFYARVYAAERPEIFFKATASRVAGPGRRLRIRRDSTWDVPEPEITLALARSGEIIGYTIGNDMSSRSIEGENPLYLPQAKTYEQCAGLGPCVLVTPEPLSPATRILIEVRRDGGVAFSGDCRLSDMKRDLRELRDYLMRELVFPHGAYLMTGTGIVPGPDFTLQPGDEVAITVEPIGTLVNGIIRAG